MDKNLYGEQPRREEGAKRRIRAGMAERRREPQTNPALPGSSLTGDVYGRSFIRRTAAARRRREAPDSSWHGGGGSRRQTQPFPGARSRRSCLWTRTWRTAAARVWCEAPYAGLAWRSGGSRKTNSALPRSPSPQSDIYGHFFKGYNTYGKRELAIHVDHVTKVYKLYQHNKDRLIESLGLARKPRSTRIMRSTM